MQKVECIFVDKIIFLQFLGIWNQTEKEWIMDRGDVEFENYHFW